MLKKNGTLLNVICIMNCSEEVQLVKPNVGYHLLLETVEIHIMTLIIFI